MDRTKDPFAFTCRLDSLMLQIASKAICSSEDSTITNCQDIKLRIGQTSSIIEIRRRERCGQPRCMVGFGAKAAARDEL